MPVAGGDVDGGAVAGGSVVGGAVAGGAVAVGGSVVVVVVGGCVVTLVLDVAVRAELVFFDGDPDVARLRTKRTATPEVTTIFVGIFHLLSHTSTSPTGKNRISATTTTHVRRYHSFTGAGGMDNGGGWSPTATLAAAEVLPSCAAPGASEEPGSGGLYGGVSEGNHMPSGACQ